MNKLFYVFLYCLFYSGALLAQDLSNLRSGSPVKVTGSIGTLNTFFNSSNSFQMRSPMANTLFANLNIDLYGFQVPLSFHLSNDNRDFSHPFARFGISPRYKSVQLHLGYRGLNFSPFTYNNLSFLGAGLDVNWRLLRLSVFSGSLNQAREFSVEEAAGQRPLSYHRQAYGIKLGLGNSRNFFDLILFNARDDTLSINPMMNERLQPKENLILGTSFRISLGNRIAISSNIAASAFNDNMRTGELQVDELNWLKRFYTPRYGTELRLAGDIRAQVSLAGVQTMLQYRLIQPGFNSLGISYMANNMQQVGINTNAMFLNNRLSANISVFYQQDNVTKTQLYTHSGTALNLNTNARFSNNFLLSLNYNSFIQQQKDGTAMVKDSTRLDRIMHNLTIIPTYTLTDNKDRTHSFNGNINTSISRNRNKLQETAADISTYSTGAGYNITFEAIKLNIMANYNYQESSSDFFSYNAHSVSLGGGKRFLENANLAININTNISLGQMDSGNKNISLMTGVSSSYTWNKNHTANFRTNFNHINNYQVDRMRAITGYDTAISIGYTYRFTPIIPGRRNDP